ncbi:hypothetical protein GTP56_07980 [Duganella sp. FT134W]|uniref:DUF6651 domain-containing protein n=1 Tax=Duganella margarita TaxID=2692170 RepID=A0A7X4H0V3_9BURK|nr:DUF6651 domain-containing protein [Duganella margarita]MYM72134.1 hypothetical protein [Duganella margarita]
MKLKLNKDGSAVVRNGMPVYVHANGREEAFDAPAAWKLALGKHFETSPVMTGLKLPADVAASFFGDSFRIEAGKLVAVDKLGIQLYSPTRHGEAADFNEAFAQLVDRYERKGMIQREPDAGAAPGAAAPAGRQQAGSTITRAQFDSLPPESKGKFMAQGGRIADGLAAPAGKPVASAPPAGGKAITRAAFDQMPQTDRHSFVKSGGRISD